MPFQRRFGAVHPQAEVIFFASKNLEAQRTPRAPFSYRKKQAGIVFKPSTLNKSRKFRA